MSIILNGFDVLLMMCWQPVDCFFLNIRLVGFLQAFLLPQPASPPHSPHVLEMLAQSFGGSQVHQETKLP